MKKIIVILFAMTSLTGCETTNSISYKASASNVFAFQKKLNAEGKKVSVGKVTVSNGVDEKPNCRLMGPIVVAPGKQISQYVKEALQEELMLANSFDPSSNIVLDAEIDELSFNSVSPAGWKIGLKIQSNKSQGYKVAVDYKFDTSWTAANGCKNAADAFGPAVQELLKKIIEDKAFDDLLK